MSTSSLMPLLFIGHGSPMNAIEDNPFSQTWRKLGQQLPKPQAILCLSAHYTTRGHFATGNEQPPTIHDFYGFPQALFAQQYPAPGSPALAQEVVSLSGAGSGISLDWGLDHGTWSVLLHLFPKADIPVVQLSLDLSLTPKQQMEVGRRLSSLRKKGILIMGSGNIVHNLRTATPAMKDPYPWAVQFGDAIDEMVLQGKHDGIANYQTLPGAAQSVPTTEHFVPLLYILGAADKQDKPTHFNHAYTFGSLSMTGYALGIDTN